MTAVQPVEYLSQAGFILPVYSPACCVYNAQHSSIISLKTMPLRLFMLTLCLPLFLTACTTTQQPLPLRLSDQVRTDQGMLYLYRPQTLRNVLQLPQLMINGRAEAVLSSGELIRLSLVPGQQRLSLQLAQQNLETVLDLHVQAQQLYFVRLHSALSFSAQQGWQREFHLQQVDQETALAEMQPMLRKQHKPVASETEAEKADDNGSRFSIQKTQNPFAR